MTPFVTRAVRRLGDFLTCLALTLVWSWPYARRAGSYLRDAYDAQAHVWVLSWVRHALSTSPSLLFQANAYAPNRDVLAFSEPLIGYGVLGLPLAWLGLSDVAILNAVCLLCMALSLHAVASLAEGFGVPRGASLLGAAAVGFGASQTTQLGYVSFSAWGGLALVALAWLRVHRHGTLRSILAAGLLTAALGWLSLQLLAFAFVAVLAALFATWARERNVRDLRAHLAAGALAGLLLVPLAIPLARVRKVEGFRRQQAETRQYSASLSSWLTTTGHNPAQAWLPWRSESETALYPGTVTLLLAAFTCVRRRRNASPVFRVGTSISAGTFGLLWIALGVLGSLGYSGPLYPLLVRLLPPVFGGVRAAARFAFVAQVGFGLLAAVGAARLFDLCRPAWRKALAAGGTLLCLADGRQTADVAFHPEIPRPPVERFLAAASTGGPILHLPLTHGAYEGRYLFASVEHFKPIVNGALSWVPRRHEELVERLQGSPIPPDTMDLLETWPVGVVVLHEHAVPLERLRATLAFLARGVREGRLAAPLHFAHRGGEDWLFGVRRARGDAPWGGAGGGDPARNAEDFLTREMSAPVGLPAAEDHSFPASIDAPKESALVAGPLVVLGWTEDEKGPGQVLDVLIDGDRREATAARRVPRPDVAAALPALGDCATAGFEIAYPFLPGDEGRHQLRVRLRSAEGRVRTLRREFLWEAEPRGR